MVRGIENMPFDISTNPFVGDKLPSSQRTTGFATQTFFIGLGAVIASILPYIITNVFHVSNTAPAGQIGDSVKYSFYVGAVVLFLSVLWTVVTSDELPPEDLQKWEEEKAKTKGVTKGLVEISKGIFSMPRTMLQLAVVQFFTWFGFYSMWLYTTPSIAQNAYGTIDPTSQAFQDAGDWVGVMFTVYSAVSAITAFMLPVIARRVGRKYTHMICLVIGGIGLFSLIFIKSHTLLLVPMVAVGLAWASTLTLPYAILAGSLPPAKMGFFMGVFNFFIVIPQLIASVVLGYVIKDLFHEQAIYALVIGGISMVIGGILNFIVQDKDEKIPDVLKFEIVES
jgi:maltose/moltooligosaccharide transporter